MKISLDVFNNNLCFLRTDCLFFQILVVWYACSKESVAIFNFLLTDCLFFPILVVWYTCSKESVAIFNLGFVWSCSASHLCLLGFSCCLPTNFQQCKLVSSSYLHLSVVLSIKFFKKARQFDTQTKILSKPSRNLVV